MQNINKVIYDMMMTSTGMAMCDSGFGERGRAWQRNKLDYPTIETIEKSPVIETEQPEQYYTIKDQSGQFVRRFTNELEANEYAHANNFLIEKDTLDSRDIDYTVSLFHHLTSTLEIDETCNAFNALLCDDWNSEKAYGISEQQAEWLENHGLVIGDTWNSYNYDSNLSQVLQGANVNRLENSSNFEYPEYILLQIHQGADVRGGYTDAKLFKVSCDYFSTNPDVYGDIDGITVSTLYDGNTLLSDDNQGEPVPVTPNSIISLYLNEY